MKIIEEQKCFIIWMDVNQLVDDGTKSIKNQFHK